MAIRIKLRAGSGEIKALISHPTENGLRKDAKTGQIIPAHFINSVIVTLNGKTILDGQWSGGVSKDPFLAFRVKGMKAGDTVNLSVKDNKGDNGSIEATVG